MRKFEINDRFTTSDIGLDIEADSLRELFLAGAEGMFAIIIGEKPTGATSVRREIELAANSNEQLLVDWLSELLYLFDAEGLIAGECILDISTINENYKLRADVKFRPFSAEMDAAEHEVKAVTYYKLEIKEEGGRYGCHVVFDL
jgi:SHS2 domain-containing protein